jgi:ATP-dependent Clp protease ATP-binding subunit ClpC
MTSNVGSQHVLGDGGPRIGFAVPDEPAMTEQSYESMQNKGLNALKGLFRPELLNRIDEVVVFLPLSLEDMKKIVGLMMAKVQANLTERDITVRLTEAAQARLAEEGYDPAYGARPLRRVIQRQVENNISRGLLDGTFRDGDTIVVDVEDGHIITRLFVETDQSAA